MQDFRKLAVWEKSHQLTLATYETTKNFPKEELYALTSQMRRAAASIPSNIAEGCGRVGRNDKPGNPEFVRFLRIALGSANELDYQILLAKDLEFLNETSYGLLNGKVTEVKRMLTSFILKITSEA